MSTLRLDRFLADALGVSRPAAQRLCRDGRVRLGAPDGPACRRPADHIALDAAVFVDGVRVAPRGPAVLLLHKPEGCVSATIDADHTTVLDLIPAPLRTPGLAPAGRLDKDTTGLLILTDDGPLLHRLTHPRRHVPKVYEATLARPLPDDADVRVRAGLVLADGTHLLPSTLQHLAAHGGLPRVRLTIHEGRYHQVRRMMAALGSHVVALKRVAIGGLALPPDLPPGTSRPATAEELALALSPEPPSLSDAGSGT
jgi:16S rRNA pseudouridine516 synthase